TCDLREASFRRATLVLAVFTDDELEGVWFAEGNLERMVVSAPKSVDRLDLPHAAIVQTVLMKADLRRADFSGARIELAILLDTDLSGQSFAGVDLGLCQLMRAKLVGCDLSGAKLERT